MPQQDHHPHLLLALSLAGGLEPDVVTDATKRYDLDPDATTEVPQAPSHESDQ